MGEGFAGSLRMICLFVDRKIALFLHRDSQLREKGCVYLNFRPRRVDMEPYSKEEML